MSDKCFECESELTKTCFSCNTRAVPDVPELEGIGKFTTMSGTYIPYEQAAEIIAAKDAEIERLKNLIDGDDCPDPDKIDALFRRAEAAEAKLAQYEAQEPVAYTLIFRKSYGVNTETTFKKFEDAEKYAIRCELPLSSIIPLYTSPVPAADLKAKCDRYEQTLRVIAELSATGMSFGDLVFAVTISRAALNVETSHDKG